MPGFTLSPDQLLDNARFNALIADQATRFVNQLPLRFIDRLTSVNADDDEIIGTYTDRVFAADVVGDDQAAAVYGGGQLSFITNTLAVIKHGRRMPASMMGRLNRIGMNLGTQADGTLFGNWESAIVGSLLRGVREQENALACGMMIDSYTYTRNGITIVGNWGRPADMKSTPGTLWTSTSATPVTDIQTAVQYAAETYGVVLDRVTMPRADFRNMTKTTEFKDLLAGLVRAPLGSSTNAFGARDPRMVGFASDLLEMQVEFDDKTYIRQNPDGTIAAGTRVLPLGKVLLNSSSDDKNPAAWDWGNAIVNESLAARLTGFTGNFPTEQYGPIGYYTPQNAQLNPPGVIAWAVARGFPRAHNIYNTYTLTVR